MFCLCVPIQAQKDSIRGFSFVASIGPAFFTEDNKDEMDMYEQGGFDEITLEDYFFEKGMGYQLNAMASYRFTPLLSVAVQYRYFTASASCKGNFDPQDGIHMYYGQLSESINVNYAGAGLYLEDLFRMGKIRYRTGLSAGIAFYRNAIHEMWTAYLMTGKTIMFGPSIGAEIPMSQRISILIDAAYLYGVPKKIKVRTEYESVTIEPVKKFRKEVSNVGLTASIKFSL